MWRGPGIVVCALAALAIGVPTASAATEIGDSCTGNKLTEGDSTPTVAEVSAEGNTMPTAVPATGVITKWTVNVVPTTLTFSQSLKVLRPNPGTKTVLILGEDSRIVAGGVNSFDVRIPVQAGDRIGLFGASSLGTLYCDLPANSVLLAYAGGGVVGSSTAYAEVPTHGRVPVTATIEPDADGDGYGDETQDKCPQSTTVQAECPTVLLDAVPAAGNGLISVYVSSSTTVPVTVSGVAALPKAAKRSAGASAEVTLKKVTKTVTPDKIARFTLNLPRPLKAALAALPPGKRITVKISASAKSAIGAVTTDRSKLRLP